VTGNAVSKPQRGILVFAIGPIAEVGPRWVSMNGSTIVFRGVPVDASWLERFETAQNTFYYSVSGRLLERIRFGDEIDGEATVAPACACTAVDGEFHVPGCARERCPECGGVAVDCSCDYDEGPPPTIPWTR
jgi:hypothetical protein